MHALEEDHTGLGEEHSATSNHLKASQAHQTDDFSHPLVWKIELTSILCHGSSQQAVTITLKNKA
jgi:hypothetical protein